MSLHMIKIRLILNIYHLQILSLTLYGLERNNATVPDGYVNLTSSLLKVYGRNHDMDNHYIISVS